MPNGSRVMIPKAQIWLVLNFPVFMVVYIHFNVPPPKITDLVRNLSDEKIWNSLVCVCFCFYQLGLCSVSYTADEYLKGTSSRKKS